MQDFISTAPGKDPIVAQVYYAVKPAQVFSAWTDPEIVVKWFGRQPNSLHSATIDLRPGGRWCFVHSSDAHKTVQFEGEYLEVIKDVRLVYSWCYVVDHKSGTREQTPDSRVEVTFSARGTGTQVRLVHSQIRSHEARLGIGSGWQASFHSLDSVLTGN